MRYFDMHRQALIKKSLLRGAGYTVSANKGQVAIVGSAGVGIDHLEINGNSFQADSCTIDVSSATEYCGISSDIDSYYDPKSEWGGWTLSAVSFKPGALLDGETLGMGLFLPLPKAWQGEGVSFELVRKSEGELASDVDLYLGYGVMFGAVGSYDGLTPLLVDGKSTSLTTDGATEYNYLIITDLMQDVGTDNPNSSGRIPGPTDLKLFSHDYKLIVKKYVSKPSPTIPIDIRHASSENGVALALKESRLPLQYQEVEYIQSHGEEYILTGFTPNQATRVVADFQLTDIYSSFVFGTRHASSYAFTFSISGAGNLVAARKTSGNKTIATADKKRHIVDYNRGVVSVDNTSYTFADYTFTAIRGLTLFACADRQEDNSGYLPSKMKLYFCKIYDNDVLVRSLVPCYRKLDYVAGLYDLVNGVFYENKGGGAFSFDNEVNTIASKDISDFEYYSDILRVQIPKRIDFENLFDVSKAILTGCYIDDNGAIVASSATAYMDIPLEAGEYTLYLEKSNDFSVYLYSGQTNDGSALVGSLKPNENEVSFTHKDTTYLRLWWITEGNSISKIRITKGSYTYVELDFAGIDGYKDKLIVDRTSKRVSYLQAIDKLVLDGKKSLTVNDINGHNEYCYSGRLYQLYENNCGLCSHFGIADTQNEENTVGFLPRGSMVFFRCDDMEDQEELNAFFSEQYKNGTPVTVYCVRKEPEEFDLSNTQFAKDLFSLNLPYEHNGGLVIEGDLECGEISVTYLATGYEDTRELKINYVDLSGGLLKDSRTYSIRKGSKYKAYAPELEGYIPLKSEYEGYMTEKKEITIQYRRA